MNENTNSSYIIRNISSTYSLACVNMSKILCCYSLCSEVIPQKQKTAWWRITDSNRWPPACKAGALANWANPPREKREEILKKHLHELMSPSRNWSLEHIRPSRCVVPGRLELPTSTLSVWRSNQLSYRTELEESTEAILSDFPFSYSWKQSQCSTRRKTNQGSFSSLDITVKL